MAHCLVPAAEELLDRAFPVLDKGFVRLVDYLGGDERIVQAARVSYGAGTKSFREDSALIDHLLRQRAHLALRAGDPHLPRQAADLRRAAMDPAQDGPRQRGLGPLLGDEGRVLPAGRRMPSRCRARTTGRAAPRRPCPRRRPGAYIARMEARPEGGLRGVLGACRCRARAGARAHRPALEPLHRMVLADRPAQSLPLPPAEARPPRPARDREPTHGSSWI